MITSHNHSIGFSPRRRVNRREALRVGMLSGLGGLTLADALRAETERSDRKVHAKNVIVLYLLGGAATQDMWDLKPNAPVEVRGEFKPMATRVPGMQFCEHLPKLARWAHRMAIVRSVHHKAGCHNCLPSYTGYEQLMPDQHPRDTDPPSMGSICEWLRVQEGRTGAGVFPDYVYMPCWLGWGQVFRRSGPYGGFLGKRFDALTTECKPHRDAGMPETRPGYPNTVRGEPLLPEGAVLGDLSAARFSDRRTLLTRLDAASESADSGAQFERTRRRAFGLMTSEQARAAFDLTNEDPKSLDRYGRTLFGHSTLIARRLIESGVRFVNVTWDLFWDRVKVDYDAWDTHTRNFPILKENKLPGLDHTVSALFEDLHERGLLDETLVVITSEMGRTPKINANGGRDHWTHCYGTVFAGGGIRGGVHHGASDGQAAYVKDLPVSTADICCTVYDRLGIDPEMTVPDRSGRPVPIAHGGRPIAPILL